MIKYPNGKVVLTKQHSPEKKQRSSASKQGIDFAKRGMSLEQERTCFARHGQIFCKDDYIK